MTERFAGRRVTVMGLGIHGGGIGVARWLVRQGADVTVTDRQPAERLTESLRHLEGLSIRYVLGEHDERDFTAARADIVVRNPGVRRQDALLELARREGVRVEMEMSLFLRACPAPVIGVTGTKGKTTTCTLTAAMLRAHDPRTILAGNMGVSALEQLHLITPTTPVVVELSSWQVEALIEHGIGPHVGVLTNIAEDHLNTYADFEDYADTKRGLIRVLDHDGVAILNADDPNVSRAAAETRARVIPFGISGAAAGMRAHPDGAWLEGDQLVWREGGQSIALSRPPGLALAGEHGARNALAAIATAINWGASPQAAGIGLARFSGVKDRMEPIAEVRGVRFINDTTATAPAAAIAALRVLADERVHLIAGGSDKQSDLRDLATAAAGITSVRLLDGTATAHLGQLIRNAGGLPDGPFPDMDSAVHHAFAQAEAGDVVLLSPGCASFGMFANEFQRGERFRDAVARLDTTRVDSTVDGEVA